MKIPVTKMSERDKREIAKRKDEILPRVLPPDWELREDYANACWYRNNVTGAYVCAEVERHESGHFWLHVSVSYGNPDQQSIMPSYQDLKAAKDLFVGLDRKALQVFPPRAEHFNFHPRCLHLFAPLDHDPVPDLRDPSGGL